MAASIAPGWSMLNRATARFEDSKSPPFLIKCPSCISQAGRQSGEPGQPRTTHGEAVYAQGQVIEVHVGRLCFYARNDILSAPDHRLV